MQKIFGDFRPDYPACRNRIIRPWQISAKLLSLLHQVCVNFRFDFNSVVSYSYIKKKKKREKKSAKKDTKEKEKCNIIVVYLVRPSSYIALVD